MKLPGQLSMGKGDEQQPNGKRRDTWGFGVGSGGDRVSRETAGTEQHRSLGHALAASLEGAMHGFFLDRQAFARMPLCKFSHAYVLDI